MNYYSVVTIILVQLFNLETPFFLLVGWGAEDSIN